MTVFYKFLNYMWQTESL